MKISIKILIIFTAFIAVICSLSMVLIIPLVLLPLSFFDNLWFLIPLLALVIGIFVGLAISIIDITPKILKGKKMSFVEIRRIYFGYFLMFFVIAAIITSLAILLST